jgi:F-type H+-transporting ATPase subunit b
MISLDYTVVYQMIIFLIVWVVLTRIFFRPYLALIEERERRTAGMQLEAAELTHEGERLKTQYDGRIAQAQVAGVTAKEAILQEARQQRDQLLAHARQEAARALEEVRQEVQRQMETEKQLATAEVAVISQEMVSKILGRRFA